MSLHRLIASALLTLTFALPLAFAAPAQAESGCHDSAPPRGQAVVINEPVD